MARRNRAPKTQQSPFGNAPAAKVQQEKEFASLVRGDELVTGIFEAMKPTVDAVGQQVDQFVDMLNKIMSSDAFQKQITDAMSEALIGVQASAPPTPAEERQARKTEARTVRDRGPERRES